MAAKSKVKNENVSKINKSTLNKYFKSFKSRRYLILVIFLILVGIALYLGKSLFIAAIVGGRPITRLELVKELEKQSGKETLDNLVTKNLINQKAQKEGVTISNEDIQKEIENISKMVESQGSTLDAALSIQGQTRADLEENIRVQKTVEKMLQDEVKISDADLLKYFEDNKSLYGNEAKFEDLKEDIRGQLKQEKLSAAFQEWMTKLKSESKIIYFVNF
ncbi:MAG: PpiC-type peptidyl-prolyl cis-trans isomerase [Candidatus Woesebacteria bacterium GW2011_GWB1_39_12]|uniref:peptidylprolyl isomerase n=2 Tax=Candidatus Woeseibacteriota TaxID=1752722 RepID=A0A0G0Q776_9BACT|nr:MAG: PpiC-type peptidyl-prolyl cis-trans isomerase [Candidatus Woesebacteria bacterium GW2011_GWA1_39_12]KKR00505.1 MAG: PpiC-type peptidyl-prolyl cis-trans isomerase [Candidatus Woesebacteria bacterium GW2011_GWB1_39_12]